MAEMPNPQALDEAAGGSPKKGKSPLLIAIVTALLVGPLAVGGGLMMAKGKAAGKSAKDADKTKAKDGEVDEENLVETVTFPLPTQTVNLADGDRYVRCRLEMSFELEPGDADYFRKEIQPLLGEDKAKASGSGGGEGEGEKKEEKKKKKVAEPGPKVQKLVHLLSTNQAQLNDAMISELSQRKFEGMLRPQDKDELKKALAKRFDGILTSSKVPVHDIYLSEFVMQ